MSRMPSSTIVVVPTCQLQRQLFICGSSSTSRARRKLQGCSTSSNSFNLMTFHDPYAYECLNIPLPLSCNATRLGGRPAELPLDG